MDEFYLPEDVAEWIGQKKSEYLSKLVENVQADDFQFEDYHRFDELIPSTIGLPDWSSESIEDKQTLRTYCRSYADPEVYQQVVIGVVVLDQDKNEVFIPIISFVSRKENLIGIFCAGKVSRPALH